MSILNKVTTGRRGRAQKVVVYAPEGFGKSTLASQFPAPLFLDVEDSTSQLDVQRLDQKALPDLKTLETVLAEVAKERPCATLVVDTIDWLEEMAIAELCTEHKVGHIEELGGGFGKGYNYLTTRIAVTLAKFDRIIDAGIHVLFLAHSSIVRFDPPDGAGAFDRYELKLYKDRKGGKGSASLIKEWADMLLFGNWRTQIAEKGKGDNVKYKGVGGKERLLYANRTAAWDAKNRHGLDDTQPWGIEVIEKAFRSVNAPWGNAAAKPLEAAAAAAPATTGPGKPESDAAPTAPKQPEEMTATPPESTPAPAAPPPTTGAAALSAAVAAPVSTAQAVKNETDDELLRICSPHAEAVTSYLRSNNKIKADQDWRAMPADFAARVKKNPAGFLKVVGSGKAVAA